MSNGACPKCNSMEVDETDKFDLTVISNDSCTHDFECTGCGCLFTVEFHPINAIIVGHNEDFVTWG